MRKLGAAVVLAMALATSACGSDGPPTQDEIADGLQKSADAVLGEDSPLKTIPKKVADCMAKVLTDSDLSSETLKAIAQGDKSLNEIKKDAATLAGLAPDLVKCITDNVNLSDLTGK